MERKVPVYRVRPASLRATVLLHRFSNLRVWLICLHARLCIMCVPDALGGKRAMDLLELERNGISSARWVLGIEPKPSGRATHTAEPSLQPMVLFFGLFIFTLGGHS